MAEDAGNSTQGRVTFSGLEIIIAILFIPLVWVWLFLAARIVISATTSVHTLTNIEGLLAVLGGATLLVNSGFNNAFEQWQPASMRDASGRIMLTGREFIILWSFVPTGGVWLYLTWRVVSAATLNTEALEHVENLILAMTVISIPVTRGMEKMYQLWRAFK